MIDFNYFSCMSCGVVVDEDNVSQHISHNILGEKFVIKTPKKKIAQGLVSQTLVRKMREEKEMERYEKNLEKEKLKKIRAQERFEKEIPSGDIIVNILESVA